jgi:hypothetical protein
MKKNANVKKNNNHGKKNNVTTQPSWKITKKLPFGKMFLGPKIGSGCNASVFTAYFPAVDSELIVKRINLEKATVFGRLYWQEAGLKKPPKKQIKVALENHVIGLSADFDELIDKENVSSTEIDTEKSCIVQIKSIIKEHSDVTTVDGAQRLYRGNEYLNEAAVGRVIDETVNTKLPSPIFCKMLGTWETSAYGNIVMEDAGQSLGDNMYTLSVNEIKSIVLQVIIGIIWGQHCAHFKHHDLHSGNVFFIKKRIKKRWLLPSGLSVSLPHAGVQAVIADFGLSSITDSRNCTRYCRIDYGILDVREKGWGTWNEVLKGNEGYDIAVFLQSLCEDCHFFQSEVEEETRNWILNSFKILKSLSPPLRMSKKQGRPFKDVSIDMEEFIKKLL